MLCDIVEADASDLLFPALDCEGDHQRAGLGWYHPTFHNLSRAMKVVNIEWRNHPLKVLVSLRDAVLVRYCSGGGIDFLGVMI